MTYEEPEVVNNSINLMAAQKFVESLPSYLPKPYINHSIYTEEVLVQWYNPEKKSLVPEAEACFHSEDWGFGNYGYTYRGDDRYFVPGKDNEANISKDLPEDLLDFLRKRFGI